MPCCGLHACFYEGALPHGIGASCAMDMRPQLSVTTSEGRLLHLCSGSDLSPAWSFAPLVFCQASSRELRTISSIGRSSLPQCVSRPPSLITIDIHSESIADTPSIIMGNMVSTTLWSFYDPIQPDNAESLLRLSDVALGLHCTIHNDACSSHSAQ